jgi:hypothetical protein
MQKRLRGNHLRKITSVWEIIHDTFFSGEKLFNFKNMAAAKDDVNISSYRENDKSIQYKKLWS